VIFRNRVITAFYNIKQHKKQQLG